MALNFWKIIFLFSLFLPLYSSAYIERTVGGSLIAEVNPRAPKPNQMVNIKLSGYGFNLDTSDITWILNNEIMDSGRGMKEFSFQMGGVGSVNSLYATVETRTERTLGKNLIFRPAEVELMFESNTYVPRGYRGARLPSPGSLVKVVAKPNFIINNENLDPTSLEYQWRRNGTLLSNENTNNPEILIFRLNEDGRGERIEVSVFSRTYGSRAENSIIITPVNPEIILYENRPLLGVDYKQAITDRLNLSIGTISLKAEPFYFPGQNINDNFFAWFINQERINQNTANPSQINLERPVGSEGSFILTTIARNMFRPTINIQKQIEIILNGQQSNEF